MYMYLAVLTNIYYVIISYELIVILLIVGGLASTTADYLHFCDLYQMQMMIFINLIHLKKMSIMLLLHFQSSSLTIVFNDMSLDFICVVCTN